MKFLITFANIIWLSAAIFMVLMFALMFIYHFQNTDDKKPSQKLVYTFLISGIILASLYITMKDYWGENTLYSFYSKTEFNTRYYVLMFPENSESKNYRVPADLHVKGENLLILRVQWPNGGYTTFENNGSDDSNEFYINKGRTIIDDEDRSWLVLLTDNKCD